MTQNIPPAYSVGAISRHYGVEPWQVRRAIARGFLGEPARVGPYRIFTPEQLPLVRAALIKAGYLDEVPA